MWKRIVSCKLYEMHPFIGERLSSYLCGFVWAGGSMKNNA